MVARVYGGEEWFVRDEGGTGRAECLYERKGGRGREVRFIVARLTGGDGWARGRAARDGGTYRGRSRGAAVAVDGETAAEGAAGRADDTGETMRVGGSGVNGGGKRGREGGSVRGEEGQRGGRTGRLEVNGRAGAEYDTWRWMRTG